MAWTDAKQLADEWCAAHLPVDLRGRILQAPDFADDHTAQHIDEDNGEDAWSAYSPEFRTLLCAFRDKGYSYLRLDADGDKIAGWQTFD